MTDNITAGDVILKYIIPVAGILIAAITAFGVFYGPRLVAKRQEKKGKLSTHFDGIRQKIIYTIVQIISGIADDYGTLDASTLRGSKTMDDDPFPILFGFEERDEYQAFQTHYPTTDKKWQELVTQTWKHNEDVEAAIKELEEIIKNNPDLPPIKPFAPSKEEKVIPETITLIYRAIYSIAQGQRPLYDFSELHVTDYGEFQIISVSNASVVITTKEKIEQCKSALLELQNSSSLRERALGLSGNTFQLTKKFEALTHELQSIYDYGLISNKVGHKFAPTKHCVICKRIFYRS